MVEPREGSIESLLQGTLEFCTKLAEVGPRSSMLT